MGSQECFVLRWNEFPLNFVTNLRDLRDEFFDVTLACDENSFVRGHKVVLSAASPYFRSILKASPQNQHPVLLMPPGIQFRDLVQLVDFIYNGEISVVSEDLNSFMSLAEHLKIRGLTDEENVRQQEPKLSQKQAKAKSGRPGSKKRKADPQLPIQEQSNDGQTLEDYDDQNYHAMEEENVAQPGNIQLTGLVCPQCRAICHGVEALKSHIATEHRHSHQEFEPEGQDELEEPPAFCDICDKPFKNLKCMIAHKKRIHNIHQHSNPEAKRGRPSKSQVYFENETQPSTSGSVKPSRSYEIDRSHLGASKPKSAVTRGPSVTHFEEPGEMVMAHQGRQTFPARAALQPSFSAEGVPKRQLAPPIQKKIQNQSGRPRMDISHLGRKLGGQISITSTGSQMAMARNSTGQGRSIPLQQIRTSHPARSTVQVKEEPMDDQHLEEGEEFYEDQHGDDHQYDEEYFEGEDSGELDEHDEN